MFITKIDMDDNFNLDLENAKNKKQNESNFPENRKYQDDEKNITGTGRLLN